MLSADEVVYLDGEGCHLGAEFGHLGSPFLDEPGEVPDTRRSVAEARGCGEQEPGHRKDRDYRGLAALAAARSACGVDGFGVDRVQLVRRFGRDPFHRPPFPCRALPGVYAR